MNDAELEQWISDCAQYIRRTREQKEQSRKDPEAHKIVKRKIERAEKYLTSLMNELAALHCATRRTGKWRDFRTAQPYIDHALHQARAVLGPLHAAKAMAHRETRTRALKDQRSAVRLAYAVIGNSPRSVKNVSRRIMLAAEIDEPGDEAMTKWIRQEAQRDIKNNPPPDKTGK
jgi:hypothetical protein